ncbi:DUF418 domain-containing protein [Urechidicola croceus]|uniref:DUF418 domain-containing protein n=1 Tax=Urechidicola croceus TaxID=1850246 RepID=A0A1D8PBB1_9FLAO|nr:DUF418 domain-containing protein [Urechidicola croceus]AOW21858.1 hypothetical protein LPB138_14705 [Urechidicola croceus]
MQNNRIQVIDALRGFSLAGIVLVHMIENYLASPPPETGMQLTNQGLIDGIVQGFTTLFIQGKFFALFSFLFGVSFFIQMNNGAKRNNRFELRFLWRILLLLVIGAIHHLFYRGDILTIYALIGIFLIPFFRVNKKVILSLAIVFFLGLGRYIYFAFFGDKFIFSNIEMMGSSPEINEYFNTLKNGSLIEVFKINSTQGHLMKLDFQFGVFGRGYLTFAFFLLGLYAGKIDFFNNFKNYRKKITKGLIWSIVLFLISMGVTAGLFINMSNNGQTAVKFDNWISLLALTSYDLANIFMTFIIILSFLLIFLRTKGEKFLSKFSPYGKMALTNYILQSIIGTFILYGWGLGFIGELRHVYTFVIGLLLIVLQMIFSNWWLSKYRYGPLEWLWRSATYFKKFPFKL